MKDEFHKSHSDICLKLKITLEIKFVKCLLLQRFPPFDYNLTMSQINMLIVLSLIKINYKINQFHVIKNEKHNVNIEETMMSVMLFVVWTINKKGVI